ncbi:major centromere autoantigen B-like protein [Rhynchospora pubera]|uniref:Major centromere autoantigen B-like protein n=1 Tax=Rhynchospora pubera TaxID=906938 RepID=A0AAV8EUY8_9POAL|nr:major centromere autoantigen B-like protein [Rhynchospora pubera]
MEGLKQVMHSAESLQQIMEEEDQLSENTTFTGESSGSLCSSNSNVADDACSSSPSSLESQMEKKEELESNGPLYELSSLIAQLPIRRGLSKFYTGKSQSFTSLSDATSIEDLAKKETTYSRRMKMCKSYPGGLDKKQRPICPPTKIISKRQTRGSFGGLVSRMSRSPTFQLN